MRLKDQNKTTKPVLVYTTVEKRKDAESIAEKIVKEGLSACVNIIPGLTSVYTWKGRLLKAKEYMLLIKTREALIPLLEKTICSLHPYELPEFITTNINYSSKAYLSWLYKNTKRIERRKT
jgi:periplasmic divalent cation tolerance protein